MSNKDKKGVPTKTDKKTMLDQVPSDKMQDFVQRMMALAQRNLAEKNQFSTSSPILTSSEDINDQGERIAIEPSYLPQRK
jgi:hypothetical protein